MPKQQHQWVLSLPSISSEALAQSETWRVTPDQARCLVENLEVYLSTDAEIVVIPIETCPFPSLSVQALDGLENYGGVSKINTKKDARGFDEIISFTVKQLSCLTSSSIRVDGDVAYLPRFPECK